VIGFHIEHVRNARAGMSEYLGEPFLYRKPFHATLAQSDETNTACGH
jgi:hypothetical protein